MTKPSWPMYDPFEASSAFQKCPLMHTHARTRDINNAFCQSLWLLQQPKPSKHAFGGFGLHLVQLQLGTISNNQVPTIREQWCTSYTSRDTVMQTISITQVFWVQVTAAITTTTTTTNNNNHHQLCIPQPNVVR
jgi:hypothetical protein